MPHGGYGVLAHHNSHDTPATVDPKSLRDLMVMNAAYTYFLAVGRSGGEALDGGGGADARLSARWRPRPTRLVDQIAAGGDRGELGRLLHKERERMDYHARSRVAGGAVGMGPQGRARGAGGVRRTAEGAVERAVRDRAAALGVEPDPADRAGAERGGGKIVVRRKRMGTITLDDSAREQREGFPAASFWGVPVSALYWCDGKRNLAEVIRLTESRDGAAELRFRRVLQVPREARIRGVRATGTSSSPD